MKAVKCECGCIVMVRCPAHEDMTTTSVLPFIEKAMRGRK